MNYDWDVAKNKWLEENRKINFEEVVSLIEAGFLIAILKHPKKLNQKVLVIERDGYAYNVPFVEGSGGKYFLKTIYPSRTSTKKYIGEGKNEENTPEYRRN